MPVLSEKTRSKESRRFANKWKFMFFPLNHAAILWGCEETGMLAELAGTLSRRQMVDWIWSQRNRLCKSGGVMGHSICQNFYLTSRLASVDTHFWLWLLPATAYFYWVQWKSIVRTNFGSFVPSISHTKEGTLSWEIICVVEFLVMKGLCMCSEILT